MIRLRAIGTGSTNPNRERNQPRGVAKISLDGESTLLERRTELANVRMNRHRRRVLRFKEAGDARRAEHAIKMGEKALARYRRDHILK